MSDIITTPILDNPNAFEEIPKDLVTFPDCPYHCNQGKIFNPYKHTTTICPYCAEKRHAFLQQVKNSPKVDNRPKLQKEKNILERLNLKPNMFGTDFDLGHVISDEERKKMLPESYIEVRDMTKKLMDTVTLGEKVDDSMFFFFGPQGNIPNFVYPLLIKSYESGLSVAPLITGRNIVRLRSDITKEVADGIEGISCFEDLLKPDICVVFLDRASSLSDFDGAHGLMECRAYFSDKPTIIVSTKLHNEILYMTKPNTMTEKALNLASLYCVYYERRVNINSDKIANLDKYKGVKSKRLEEQEKQEDRGKTMGALTEEEFASLLGKD